ncbi:hypothetical protein C8Q77DRAFT_1105513 [Trametes polyzona]|nr:hypothetical protein C8Q77DRAFT_1105513 [Trametes polyzona]
MFAALLSRHPTAISVTAFTAAGIVIPAAYYGIKKLLARRRTQVQFTSSQFVLSAGAVPFLFVDGVPKKVVLVHFTRKNEWLLAKGRKDQGEDLPSAAIREVFEETGYRCHLHPVPRLPTRAPPSALLSGSQFQPDIVRIAEQSTEPFAITFRPTGPGQVKLIFWYIGSVDASEENVLDGVLPHAAMQGSHMAAEGFGKAALFDIDEALRILTFEGDRELVRTGVAILTA